MTEPAEAPDEADNRPNKTCDDTGDSVANTTYKDFEDPHVLYNTKYGSETLLGMKASVGAVKSTRGGKSQDLEALTHSGT